MSVALAQPADESMRTRPHPLAMLMFLFLLGMGSLLTWGGMRTIRQRHYEYHWQNSSGFSVGVFEFGSSESHGTEYFNGGQAVRVGVGLAAFGVMFVLWGLGGTWATLRPSNWMMPRLISLALCSLSIALQTTMLLCIFPPWHWGGGTAPALWMTLFLAGAVLFSNRIFKLNLQTHPKLLKAALIAFATIVILMSCTTWGSGVGSGVLVAFFSGISYAVQVGFIFANLRKSRKLTYR